PLNLTLLKGCDIVGVFWGAFVGREPERHRRNLEELVTWWRAGKLRPHVSATYPLDRAGEAIRELADRRAKGKVVVAVGDGCQPLLLVGECPPGGVTGPSRHEATTDGHRDVEQGDLAAAGTPERERLPGEGRERGEATDEPDGDRGHDRHRKVPERHGEEEPEKQPARHVDTEGRTGSGTDRRSGRSRSERSSRRHRR